MNEGKSHSLERKESVIVLAAGSSSRLGQPKQLVRVDGKPLLLKAVLAALEATYSPIVVVLGSNAEEHKKIIAHLPVEIVVHPGWENGMGSSLKAGLNLLLKNNPETKAVVVMVCDQPFLTSKHLMALRDAYHQSLNPIIASQYQKIIGVPALFDGSLFGALQTINDNQGAKAVIESNMNLVETIDWAEGSFDIDTPEDLNSLDLQQR
jgi:molybdenum cofactor cytidylyltransferase